MDDKDAPQSSLHAEQQDRDGRWIVGVDGSECSRHAALWAAQQAAGRATELQLATTWSIPVSTSMSPMGSLASGVAFDALEQAAHMNVEELARGVSPLLELPVTRSVGQGGASSLLLDAAHNSSLLVVGSRGRGGFARLLLGSTSTQCATHSTAPVAVIPATAPIGPLESIVVGFDGSASSIAALLWANHFAAPGTTIDCVSVWDTTPIAIGADQFFFPDASELAEARFEHLVTRTITPFKRNDIEVRHIFAEGQPRTILAEFAATADLLVVGARGHGAIGAAVLGSVSTWLLHHAGRPVVVVPRTAERPDDVDTEGAEREQ